MLTLFHHPFCPHSRFVRLALGRVRPRAPRWSRSGCGSGARNSCCSIRPPPRRCWSTEGYPPVPGAAIIAEYLDETRGAELHERRLMPRRPRPARRGAPAGGLVQRQVLRRGQRPAGAWSASTSATCASSRAAARPTPTRSVRRGINVRYHLAYIGWLVRTRDWLAGDQHDLRRSRRGRASVGGGLSGRCAMERRRGGEELVRAGEVAPVVPSDPGRDAGRASRRRRATPTWTSDRSGRDQGRADRSRARARLRRRRHHAARRRAAGEGAAASISSPKARTAT